MISGEEWQPINPIQHGWEVNVPINKADLKEQLAKSGVFQIKKNGILIKWEKTSKNEKKNKRVKACVKGFYFFIVLSI